MHLFICGIDDWNSFRHTQIFQAPKFIIHPTIMTVLDPFSPSSVNPIRNESDDKEIIIGVGGAFALVAECWHVVILMMMPAVSILMMMVVHKEITSWITSSHSRHKFVHMHARNATFWFIYTLTHCMVWHSNWYSAFWGVIQANDNCRYESFRA